jgi:hypothetical protein
MRFHAIGLVQLAGLIGDQLGVSAVPCQSPSKNIVTVQPDHFDRF